MSKADFDTGWYFSRVDGAVRCDKARHGAERRGGPLHLEGRRSLLRARLESRWDGLIRARRNHCVLGPCRCCLASLLAFSTLDPLSFPSNTAPSLESRGKPSSQRTANLSSPSPTPTMMLFKRIPITLLAFVTVSLHFVNAQGAAELSRRQTAVTQLNNDNTKTTTVTDQKSSGLGSSFAQSAVTTPVDSKVQTNASPAGTTPPATTGGTKPQDNTSLDANKTADNNKTTDNSNTTTDQGQQGNKNVDQNNSTSSTPPPTISSTPTTENITSTVPTTAQPVNNAKVTVSSCLFHFFPNGKVTDIRFPL